MCQELSLVSGAHLGTDQWLAYTLLHNFTQSSRNIHLYWEISQGLEEGVIHWTLCQYVSVPEGEGLQQLLQERT